MMCLLLFCVQSAWGEERYFAPNNVAVYAVFEDPENTNPLDNAYQIEGLSDIEFTLGGRRLTQLLLPQTTFTIDGINHPYFQCRFRGFAERNCDDDDGTFEVNGGTLSITAEIIIEPTTLTLSRRDVDRVSLYTPSVLPTTVEVSGLYRKDGQQHQFNSTFDVPTSFTRSEVAFSVRRWADLPVVSLIHLQRPDLFDNGFGQFASMATEVRMQTISDKGIFDIGDGTLLRLDRFRTLTMNFYGIERVPTPEQRASFLPGDADLDGAVTLSDFMRLRLNIILGDGRGTWGHGDFNGDLKLDFADFLILADNFGSVRAQAAAVPEPGLFMLLLPAILLLRRGTER